MKDAGGLNPLFGVRKRGVDAAAAELERLGRAQSNYRDRRRPPRGAGGA